MNSPFRISISPALRGFTLLEVLLVLALLAVALAVVAPTLHSMTARQALDEAGRGLIATVQDIRRTAIHEHQQWRMSAESQGTRLRAVSDRGVIRETPLPAGIRLVTSAGAPLGDICRDGRILGTELRLADQLGNGLVVDFHPLTGAVSLRRTTQELP